MAEEEKKKEELPASESKKEEEESIEDFSADWDELVAYLREKVEKREKDIQEGKSADAPSRFKPRRPDYKDVNGVPLREKLNNDDIYITDSGEKALQICMDELEKYIRSIAVARAAHFCYPEAGFEDVLASFNTLNSGMTLNRVFELIQSRLMGPNGGMNRF